MRRVLIATDSVHTTATACDYLDGRLDGSDAVYVLTVVGSEVSERERRDSENVARTRLLDPTVESLKTDAGDGGVAETILTVANRRGVDEIVVGATRGDPGRAGEPPGETVRALLETSDRPVVVVRP